MCVHVVSSAAIAPTNVASKGDSTEATHTFCRILSANYWTIGFNGKAADGELVTRASDVCSRHGPARPITVG